MTSLQHSMKFAFFLYIKYHHAISDFLPDYLFLSLHWFSPLFSSSLWSYQALFPNSLSVRLSHFLTGEKKFRSIWNTSYTSHFKVKLRRKKISQSNFCKAPIQTDIVKLSSYRKASRTAQVPCTGVAGHQACSSQRRFSRHMWSVAQAVDELCEVFVSTSANSGKWQAKNDEFSTLVSFSNVMLKYWSPFTMAFGILCFDYT